MIWSEDAVAQESSEFLLERLDSFLNVGCFTKLFWCCVNHSEGSVDESGLGVKTDKATAPCHRRA